MENPSNKFDQSVKDLFENFEAPYNDAHWEELQSELKIVSPGVLNYFSALTTGIAATGLVFMTMLYFYSDSENNSSQNRLTESEEIQLNTAIGNDGNEGDVSNNTRYNSAEFTTNQMPDDDSASSEEIEENQALPTNVAANLDVTKATKDSKNKLPNESTIPATPSLETAETTHIKKGCTGLTIDFQASGTYGKDAKYLWNFGDGYFSNEANPSHTFNKEGIFDVSLSVTSPATGQITSNIVQGMIEVMEAPIAQSQIEIKDAKGILLLNRSYNAYEAQWLIDGITSGTKPTYYLSLEAAEQVKTELIVYNKGGCTDTLSHAFDVIDQSDKFPKAISLRDNQSFAPGKNIEQGKPLAFKVFDQSGKPVFEGDALSGWNGMLPNGTSNSGDFTWVMLVDLGTNSQIYTGRISLR